MSTPASSSIRIWDAVGESHHLGALHRIIRRNSHGSLPDRGEINVPGELVREPNNPHDPRAIAVQVDYLTLGYIAREETQGVHDLFDRLDALVTPKRKWYRLGTPAANTLKVDLCLGWSRPDRIGVSVTLWLNDVFPGFHGEASPSQQQSASAPDQPREQAKSAGWYPDPDSAEGYRYWDGQQWTDQRTEKVSAAGWYPDPDGKRKQRWWDGTNWTDSYSTDWVASCHSCEWRWASPGLERSAAKDSAETHRRAFRHDPYIWRLDGRYSKDVEWPPLD